MSSQIALLFCSLFIIFLFYRDNRLRPMSSKALWVVLIWIMIIGSRTVSSWVGIEIDPDQKAVVYLEGSPLDRNIYLALLIAGLWLLARRKIDLGRVINSNRWFFAFFVYCGISIIWSDYPYIGFKRWIKDLGNVVMVLIMLTEKDPVNAIRSVLARYTYFAIPLSVLFTKYFPDLGRYYNRWSGQAILTGVATEKNTLGILTFICGLFLMWDVIENLSDKARQTDRIDLLSRCFLLVMVFWLIVKTGSTTALICLVLGTGLMLFMKIKVVRRQVRYLGTYSLIFGLLIFLLYSVPGVLESLVKMVGRDMTFTGRTEIWTDVLAEPINPLLGTGYQSFWIGPGGAHMWEKYYFHPVQAHNGYLETYLNGGLIGLSLLVATLIYTGSKLKKDLLAGSSFGTLLFSLFITAILYNWSEAMFSGLNLIWLVLIVAALYQCPKSKAASIGAMSGISDSSPRNVSGKWIRRMPITASGRMTLNRRYP